jgi:tetratricopeptide (TPR) repeat protein
MRVSLTIQSVFFTAISSLAISLLALTSLNAQVPGDPYASENAMIRPLIVSGNQKARNKDYDGAIADFTKAIELGQQLPDMLRAGPYINRGMAYADKGDLDAGLADLNKAIKLQSNNVYAYQDRGGIYRKRNEPEKAIADFNKAIKISSKFSPAYRSRGLVLLSQGKDAEAQSDFDKYLEMVPGGKDSLEKEIADIKARRAPKP